MGAIKAKRESQKCLDNRIHANSKPVICRTKAPTSDLGTGKRLGDFQDLVPSFVSGESYSVSGRKLFGKR